MSSFEIIAENKGKDSTSLNNEQDEIVALLSNLNMQAEAERSKIVEETNKSVSETDVASGGPSSEISGSSSKPIDNAAKATAQLAEGNVDPKLDVPSGTDQASEDFITVTPVDITPEKSLGVLKSIFQEGEGDDFPGYGDRVFIHYKGYLLLRDKHVLFESNRKEEKLEFGLGRGDVIKGWDLGVSTMKRGEIAYFIIQPEYAYGVMGYPPKIPAHTPLMFEIELYGWKFEDLSPKKDGGILRKVLEKGEGSLFPNEGSQMKVKLLGCFNDEVFEECEEEFTLGEGCCSNIPEGIEMALYKFHLKEKSLIFLKDKYGFGIPPKAPITYEVTLLNFEKVKDIWEMNSDEKYEKAKISRERGIAFTKAKNFKVALRHFKWIITCLEKEPGVDPESVQSRNSLLLSGYLNIALCLSKLENYKEAIKFCDKALNMQPDNEKALFRRGQAKMLINDTEEALEDFKTVCNIYPDNKAAKQCILTCQEKLKEQQMKDKSVYSKMFEKFVKQDQNRMKNMKTETGVWQNEDGEEEVHYMSETERLIEQNNSLLRDANIIELSNNICEKF